MTEATKACSLTEDEIYNLLAFHGSILLDNNEIHNDVSENIDRINYLNKRLKAFKEVEEKVTATFVPKAETDAPGLAEAWPTNG